MFERSIHWVVFVVAASVASAQIARFAGAKVADMAVPVTCISQEKAEPGTSEVVCKELTLHLSKTYPNHEFTVAQSVAKGLGLLVSVTKATENGLSLKLTWTAADGRKVEGEEMSLVVTDHTLTPLMRDSLYKSITIATPMP